MEWDLGLPMISSASTSGGRNGVTAVIPLRWRHASAAGSGHLTFRVVSGRLECVGVRVGDPGGPSAVEWGTAPQPVLTAAVFRALPVGAIIAAGAKLVSDQAAMGDLARAALEDSPDITVEMPDPLLDDSGRTPIPAHLIRAGARVGQPRDPRADSLLAALRATDLPIESARRRPGRPASYGPDHYLEIARIYADAWRAGDRHPTATVATEQHVARSTAAKWVATARRLGFLGRTVPRQAGGIFE